MQLWIIYLFAAVGLPPPAWYQQRLATLGYPVPRHGELDEATLKVLAAFQMKYRPSRHDGVPDAETAALLQVLAPAAQVPGVEAPEAEEAM